MTQIIGCGGCGRCEVTWRRLWRHRSWHSPRALIDDDATHQSDRGERAEQMACNAFSLFSLSLSHVFSFPIHHVSSPPCVFLSPARSRTASVSLPRMQPERWHSATCQAQVSTLLLLLFIIIIIIIIIFNSGSKAHKHKTRTLKKLR